MKKYSKFSIREKIKRILTWYFRFSYAVDIKTQLRIRALNTTCEYIEENMRTVQLFATDNEAMDYVLKQVSVKGSYSEFGVWKGESINYLAKKVNQDIHGFDSFEGLPEAWLGSHQAGHFALKKLPTFKKNVIIHRGWFDDTLPLFVKENNEKVAFLHIDCDLYSSTKTIFKFLDDRIVEGSIIMFDEYFNYPFWQHHEYKAFQEFVKENNIKYEYLCYSSNNFGSKVGVKILQRDSPKVAQ